MSSASSGKNTDKARGLVVVHRGSVATIYQCPFCAYQITVKRGFGGEGRGFGLATGGGAHSKVGAHIRKEHADRLTNATQLNRSES